MNMRNFLIKINHIAIEGPDKCEIQRRVEGGSTLHCSIFSNSDISINWGQNDSCRICMF